MKELIIKKNESNQRADKFLKKYLCNAGASFIYKMMRKKNITLNNKKMTGNEILNENDIIKIFFSDETIEKFTGGDAVKAHIPRYPRAGYSLQVHNVPSPHPCSCKSTDLW